jgi:hypothetical protein
MLGTAPAFAQSETGSVWTPSLVVRAVPARPEGNRASAITMERALVKGEPGSFIFWSGRSLCTLGSGEQTQAANVWKVTAELLGEQSGRHQIRVNAGFTRLRGQESSAMTSQTLSLAEGDSVVLDALSEPPDAGCPVHTVTFEAQLALKAADPSLAHARYTADLWLVHRDPSGQEHREHLVTNVSADTPAMPFSFNPLTFAIPQLDPRQGNAAGVIRLSGSLRVRPRGDGVVAIDLDTNRRVFGLENPDKPAPQIGPPLRMMFSTRDGETIAVDFPPPNGYSTLALSAEGITVRGGAARGTAPVAPSDGLELKADRLTLYPHQFFKGHKTQLLITLKKLQ